MAYPSLEGRSVIITGAGRGFGRLMALGLVAAGARVLGTAGRSQQELQQTAQLAADLGRGEFVGITSDVSQFDACQACIEKALESFGRIDVLINNAARGPLEANDDYFSAKPPFWTAPPEAYARMVQTNLTGAFFMARACTPLMLQQGFGRIVNISTSRPTMVMQGLAAYGATKAGLEAATVLWAKDLAGSGVTANVLLPGGPADTALIPGGTIGTRAIKDFKAGQGAAGDEGRTVGILPPEIMLPPTLWLSADESADFNGRRIIAKDWDPDLPPAQAAANATDPIADAPRVM
ncbi:MAG: SDR family NAD(P)-dependent oxidoreductase [Lysobacterales bacterium]